MATDQDLTDAAARLFQALPGASWLETRIGTRPWLLAFCAERGVACFEPLQSGEPVDSGLQRLSKGAEEIRLMLDRIAPDVPVRTCLVALEADTLGGSELPNVKCLHELDAGWDVLRLHASELPEEAVEAVQTSLFPQSIFTRTRRRVEDEGKLEREALRLRLDAEQLAAATRVGDGSALITGPPGSGKTLVLAARARHLLSLHRKWRLLVLCFNTTLVEHLQALVDDDSRVEVLTLFGWASQVGLRVDLDDPEQGGAAARRATERMPLDPLYDAVLIDEVQDIHPSWLELIAKQLKKGRGGMTMAGDTAQSIYLDWSDGLALPLKPERLQLGRSYRSTRQVLSAAYAMAQSGLGNEEPPDAPEGLPVYAIWGDRWDDQADALAHEIASLVEGGEYSYGDIAVLYTRFASQARRLTRTLDARGIPYYWATETREARKHIPNDDSVKLMTVHAAKGREFPVVFLFGAEALADNESKQRNLALVGASRAQDILFVTYTRPNSVVKALIQHADAESWAWPEDYEVG